MEKEIVWRKKAADKFFNIVEFLYEEWSEKTAIDFIDQVESQVKLLQTFPHLGQRSEKKKELRKYILSKQNVLIYRITNDRIILLNIYDTRQESIDF